MPQDSKSSWPEADRVDLSDASITEAKVSNIPIRRRTEAIASYSPPEPSIQNDDLPVYTVVAIVPSLHFNAFPLFPWAGSGYTKDGVQLTALIRAESPSAATDILGKAILVNYFQKVYEGVVASEELKWMGYIPQSRPRARMRSWLSWLLD